MNTVLLLLECARATPREQDRFVDYERSALHFLHVHGVTNPYEYQPEGVKDRFALLAASAIVWTIGEARAGRMRETVRGVVQIAEYHGRHGGFLPAGLSDAKDALSLYLQDALSGRL